MAVETNHSQGARTKTLWYIGALIVLALLVFWGVAQGWFTTLLVGNMVVIDNQIAPSHEGALIDSSLFDDPRWNAMTNRGVMIHERSTGRRNPFSSPSNE